MCGSPNKSKMPSQKPSIGLAGLILSSTVCDVGFGQLARWLKHHLGAAGNFLATIDGMSENAFRTVIEIDTVSVGEIK